MRESLTACREVLEDKLKNHHRNLGTLGCCEALQEWKRVCVSLGVIRNSHQHLVKSVFAALPNPKELGESSVSATQQGVRKKIRVTTQRVIRIVAPERQ